MSGNIISWIGADGTNYDIPLDVLQTSYEQKNTQNDHIRQYRKVDLQHLFKTTYHSAIQSGAGIVDAIAKAKDAVKAAGMYDEAMKQAVEARLNAEFPDDAN